MPLLVPTSHKAVALAEEIVSLLRQRFADFTVEWEHDTDQHPVIRFYDTAPVSDAAGALIKVRPVEWPLARDVLGLTATIFVPITIQVVVEEDSAGMAWGWLVTLLGDLIFKGTKLELYQRDHGAFPEIADIDPDNLEVTYHGHPQYPMMADQ